MPANRFPDSPEKRALRKRDSRSIEKFSKRAGRQLDYVGMPSVEFLDVEVWKSHLRSVMALEYDSDVAGDMRIERDRRQFPFAVHVEEGEVCEFLGKTADAFDVYNLDFYTGFVNVGQRTGQASSVNALREVFRNQSKCRRSFVLITTFNVRDRGAEEYMKFLDGAKNELAGRTNVDANLAAHSTTQPGRLKICFPFFCWQQAHANGFEQEIENVHVYHSITGMPKTGKIIKHTMVHLHQQFHFYQSGVLTVPALKVLIDIANTPLYEMREQIPHKILNPPKVAH